MTEIWYEIFFYMLQFKLSTSQSVVQKKIFLYWQNKRKLAQIFWQKFFLQKIPLDCSVKVNRMSMLRWYLF